MKTKAYVMGGWRDTDKFSELENWVIENNAVWQNECGKSTIINGKVYYSYVIFETEEDMLVCKLLFPNMVYAIK